MTFNDIKKELKKGIFRPIYFLQGDETFFIDYITNYLENKVLAVSERSFNQMVLYGKEVDIETVVTTAKRYPMMSKYQVVVVKEAQHLSRSIQKLKSYAEQPLGSTVLVINYKHKAITPKSKLGKAVSKNGVLFTAKKLYENQVPSWIRDYIKQKKYHIEPDAIALLVEYLGNDLGKISNELDKLVLNIEERTNITKNDVADNIGISKEYNVFELQKALTTKDKTKVLKITDYFATNPKAAPMVMVLGSLYRFFNLLYLYFHVKNKPEAEILKDLKLRNRYALNDYRMASRHYKVVQLKKIIHLLYQYDLRAKGINNASTPSSELLRELIIKILYI